MKFQTLSVVAGTKRCDASCPFCISRQTGLDIAGVKPQEINLRNLRKTLDIARMGNVGTAIITGKGEPTLFPHQVQRYLDMFDDQFPFVELQTNGMKIESGKITPDTLDAWYRAGLTTVLISNVGNDHDLNHKIYAPNQKEFMEYENLVKILHNAGFLVRMTCVGIKGGIDSVGKFFTYLEYCKMIGADQVTWRPVSKPDFVERTEDRGVYKWTEENLVPEGAVNEINDYVVKEGVLIRKLAHGGAVFDVNGQNVCMTDCLTHDANEDELRQLIFYPDGKLYTDWQFEGSRIL